MRCRINRAFDHCQAFDPLFDPGAGLIVTMLILMLMQDAVLQIDVKEEKAKAKTKAKRREDLIEHR